MSQGQDLSGAGEFILRRVHKNHCIEGSSVRILPVAFRPSTGDDTGISVHFAHETSPADLVAAVEKTGKSPENYYVVRLAVKDISQMGLTVIPETDPTMPPGHAVI